MTLLALEFPPVSHLVEWSDFAGDGQWYALNKIGLLTILAAVFTIALFLIAGSRSRLVPTGVQNLVEASVDFVREGIVMQTMGHSGIPWMPLLTSLFWFIFFCNIFEVIPGIQMPVTARMAIPFLLAILVWFAFNIVGVVKQGPFGYLKSALFPPGVPKALLPLVALIEFVSIFLVRPFSLAVRLFANMLAGHILLATFAVMAAGLIEADALFLKGITPLPVVVLIGLIAFEIMVAFLQAYIFTILTAVYIGGAAHADH